MQLSDLVNEAYGLTPDARGVSYGTLRRAFRELGVTSKREPRDGPFLWHLDRRAKAD